MRWVDQALRWMSAPLLAQTAGISQADIRRAKAGKASPEINRAIREAQSSAVTLTAKALGQKATMRDYPAPVLQTFPPIPPYQKAGIEKQIDAIKKDFPRYSRAKIEGLIERDQYTRQELGKALTAYQQAKQAAIKEYKRRGVKRETLDEYIKRKTHSEYKKLSEAFDMRRRTEKQQDVKKLLTKGHIDLSVENYGKGKGKWHSPKRL